MAKRTKAEAITSKALTAVSLADDGAAIGSLFGPTGAGVGGVLGGLTGLIIGDREIVFPVDMVAVPAFELSRIYQGFAPSFQIYIKEGEVLNQVQLTEAQETSMIINESAAEPKPRRKRSKWNVYTGKKANQIRFKSGKKKGLLNLKAMGVEYRRMNKTTKKGSRK